MSVKRCILDSLKHFKAMPITIKRDTEAKLFWVERLQGGENFRWQNQFAGRNDAAFPVAFIVIQIKKEKQYASNWR
jgi:hypothetical protein